MTVPDCFQMRTNFSGERISTWSCFSGSTLSCSASGRGGNAGQVDLLAVRHDEVEHLNARLVDVVLERLRLAVQDRVADEAKERDDEAERGAVHRLRDTLGEDARLLARVDALARH